MSDSTGAVKFNDGEVWYCKYIGSVDTIGSHLYRTEDEAIDSLGNYIEHKGCLCGKREEVVIHVNYTDNYVKGVACRSCLYLKGNMRYANVGGFYVVDMVNTGYHHWLGEDYADWHKEVYRWNQH